MDASPDLTQFVRCPACGASPSAGETSLDCASCGAVYPVHDGIPWLYRDVAGSRAQWAAKLQRFRTELLADLDELDAAIERDDLVDSTRERLARQRAGLERFGEQVMTLLAPFSFEHGEAGAVLPTDRIPSAQHVTSYLDTAYRDWAWGQAEIDETMALAAPLVGEGFTRALVLGGGAGRFAWELAKRAPAATVVQLDLNPLLTRIGSLASVGESTPLTELARFPLSVEDAVVDQTLEAPSESANPPIFLLGDAFAPPFADETFDLLVTPWFVDIVPEAFPSLAARLARRLAPGGRFVGFGPLSFERQGPADRLTPEEVADVLDASGWEVLQAGTETVRYLHSPHAMPRRNEEIFAFEARRPEALGDVAPFAFYPEWMTDPRKPIPADPRFESLRAERIFDVEILKCIDGRTTIEDLVVILASQYGLAEDRCRATVERFFARWFEDEGGSGR